VESKRPRIANTKLKKKKKGRGLRLPNFNTLYKATLIKNSVVLAKDHTNRSTEYNRESKYGCTQIEPANL
jgi:hypothetical protein